MNILISVEQEQEKLFEEINVEFPIYTICSYRSKKITERINGKTDVSTRIEVRKIVSPFEYFSINKHHDTESNGDETMWLELRHYIETEPTTSKGWFLLKESSSNLPATVSDWDELHTEFVQYLSKAK